MGYLNVADLKNLGLASYGSNVLISERASVYGAPRIHLGNNVRIDDFCVLSAGPGGIRIGDFVHIAVGSTLQGAGAITLGDFANISSRVAIYSSSDDFSGATMTNPMVPTQFTGVYSSPVSLERHVIVGCGSVVLPGVKLHEGAAVGALSLVKTDCPPFTISAGTPARVLKERHRGLLEKEAQLRASLAATM